MVARRRQERRAPAALRIEGWKSVWVGDYVTAAGDAITM